MGSNSIGWILYELDSEDWPSKIVRAGSRIFSNSRNAKTNIPLSVERREARGARRRRDRNLARKKSLVKFLNEKRIMPQSAEDSHQFSITDPYKLRHESLDRKLEYWELSRVLLHLSQRRGFKSNRKDSNKKEGASLSASMTKLADDILASGAKTLGSFLYLNRAQQRLSTRMRSDSGWYTKRDMYISEFNLLRQTQSQYFNSQLSDKDWERIAHLLFHQRPLKKQQPGLCRFRYEDKLERAPRALPSFQQFRMLQQLANLKINRLGQPSLGLTKEQHAILLKNLLYKKELTFKKAKELLDLEESVTFNLEEGANSFKSAKHLHGDKTSAELSNAKNFGKIWKEIDVHIQNEIVHKLLTEEDEKILSQYLRDNWELSESQVEHIVKLSDEDFESGYAEFCEEMLRELSKQMIVDHSLTYDKAVSKLGYHHSDFRPEKLLKFLSYYGDPLRSSCRITPDCRNEEELKYGKIANPTVHFALNQLRKIVNLLIQRHGYIDQIVVETARDLPLGEQGIRKLASEYKENEKKNDRWAEELSKFGQTNSYKNRQLFRLWEELGPIDDRRCPYSGEVIGVSKLFSAEVEVDHILPRSRTFTNHHSNLTVCVKRANQLKGDRSPFEAFGNEGSPFPYNKILERVRHLPVNKQRKFSPDAMDDYDDSSGFLERQLNDTRFISKATHQYLQQVCRQVWVSRGKLTAFIRSDLNLNSLLSDDRKKNRNDHRHHAVDAFIIGLTPAKTIKKLVALNRKAKKEEDNPLSQLVAEFSDKLKKVIVSHKVDHANSGGLFKDTAYGAMKNGIKGSLVQRKSVVDVNGRLAIGPDDVVDPRIRNFLQSLDLSEPRLVAESLYNKFGLKKVKVIKKDESAIAITHPKHAGRFVKYLIPGEVCRLEFWKEKGVDSDKLIPVSYRYFESIDGKWGKKPKVPSRKILTIYKGDSLKIEESNGLVRTVIVEKLNVSDNNRTIVFTDHNISENPDQKGRSVSFGALAQKKLRVVHVNEIGEVRDAGAWWLNDTKSNRDSKSG
jgi:CRISPR-associated endonuclease Csn1